MTEDDVLKLAKALHRAWEEPNPNPWPWDVLLRREQERWIRVAKKATSFHKEQLERICDEEGVEPKKLENFVAVANFTCNKTLTQSRWVRVLWRTLQKLS